MTKLEIAAIEQLNEGVVNLYAEVSVVSDKALRLRIPRLIDMDGYAAWRASFQDSAMVGGTAAGAHSRYDN